MGPIDSKEVQKQMFLNRAVTLAKSYGLSVNWETFDYDNAVIEFIGDATEKQIVEFISELSKYGDLS